MVSNVSGSGSVNYNPNQPNDPTTVQQWEDQLQSLDNQANAVDNEVNILDAELDQLSQQGGDPKAIQALEEQIQQLGSLRQSLGTALRALLSFFQEKEQGMTISMDDLENQMVNMKSIQNAYQQLNSQDQSTYSGISSTVDAINNLLFQIHPSP